VLLTENGVAKRVELPKDAKATVNLASTSPVATRPVIPPPSTVMPAPPPVTVVNPGAIAPGSQGMPAPPAPPLPPEMQNQPGGMAPSVAVPIPQGRNLFNTPNSSGAVAGGGQSAAGANGAAGNGNAASGNPNPVVAPVIPGLPTTPPPRLPGQ
jgi:hypothetical protein